MLKIVEIKPEIGKLVAHCGGFCPCSFEQTNDTKCMCKEFREQEGPGECHCGRYEKVEC